MDTDPTGLSRIGERLCGANVFRVENFVTGNGGTGGNWAQGYCLSNDGVRGRVADAVRSAAERCDRLQGVQIVHSMGGGTGSGLGARIVEDVGRAFPGRVIDTYGVAPSSTVPGGNGDEAETLNTVLCAARLVDGAHMTHVIDNRALYDACTGPLAIGAPAYADLNHLIAQTMSAVTTGLRYGVGGGPDSDMGKRAAHLVPYARLHFFVPGFTPLTYRGQTDPLSTNAVPDLADRLFKTISRCAAAVPDRGCPAVLAAACTFRGTEFLGPADVQAVRHAAAANDNDDGWLPDNVLATSYKLRCCGLRTSGAVVANTTTVADVFDKLFRR